MGVITGVGSRLEGVSTFRTASVSEVANLKELVHAGTGGGKQRFVGVKDWNGSWEEYGLEPTWLPGASIAFAESIDGTTGLQGTAIVTQVVITFPIGTKDPPTISGTFRGTAALTRGADVVAAPSAVTIPDVENLCVFLGAVAASPTYAAQTGTNEIVITLSIEDKEYHDCGSSGYMEALEGVWDANVTYKRYVDDFTDLPDRGDPYAVKIPIDAAATEYYEFQWMRVGDITDLMVDRETAELVNVTIPLEMSMIEDISGTATLGTGVTIPGTPNTTVWRPA